MSLVVNNPTDFAADLLGVLGAPPDVASAEIPEVVAWEGAEGGNWENSATDNPLNTSFPESGSVNYQTGQPGAGVQAYGSWDEGLAATVATLEQSDPSFGYGAVVSDLRSGAPSSQFATDLMASSWDAGHYAGDNPVSEMAAGQAPAAAPAPSVSETSWQSWLLGPLGSSLLGGSGGGSQPGGVLNPANDLAKILSAFWSSVWKDVKPFAITAVFLVAGAALVVVGVAQLGGEKAKAAGLEPADIAALAAA